VSRDDRRARPGPRLLVLVVASGLAALALCEGILRLTPWSLLYPPVPDFAWMAYDPRLGMVNVPGSYTRPRMTRAAVDGAFAINAHGLRGEAIGRKRALRVVCMGDSGTFGIWLASGVAWQENAHFRVDNAYPEMLAARLTERGIAAEVINAGVLGYNSGHGLRQLRLQLLDLAPDVLVVRYGFNDHAFAGPATHVEDPRRPVLVEAFYLFARSRLFQLGLTLYRRPQHAVSPERLEWNLRAIVGAARAHGARVLLVDYPLRSAHLGMTAEERMPFLGAAATLEELHATHALYQARLADVARSENVPLVTTAAALAEAPVPTFSAADLVHPNPAGARIVADEIAAAIAARAW